MIINKVNICGINTAKLPLLSNDEKVELLTKIKNGDEIAREKFVNGNLRLVLSVIQRFNNRGENVDDLFQVGCIGLIKAMDNFNMGLGVKFSSYAVPMIIGEIKRYLRDNNSVRVSRALRDIAYKALQARERLANNNQKEPTIEEIAREIECKKEDVILALDAIQEPVSLYEPIFNDGGDAVFVMDQISDEKNGMEYWLEELALKTALNKLSEREKVILSKRFFIGKTQMEVAEEIGISQAQVSRIEKNALIRIKRQL